MINRTISSLYKHKTNTLLVLALSIITYILILTTLTNSQSFNTQIKSVEEMFTEELDMIYRIDVSMIEDFDKSGINFNELKLYMNDILNMVCGSYDQSGEYFDELVDNYQYIELNKTLYKNTYRETTPNITDVVFIDIEILEMLNIQLTQKDFEAEIVNNQSYLPLYVGEYYKDIISIGDTLTLTRNGSNYVVKGFINDANWLNDSDSLTMPTTTLSNKFLAPFSSIDEIDTMTQQSTIGKIFVQVDEESQIYISNIEEKASELGIKIKLTSVTDFINKYKETNNLIIKNTFFLTFIVLICSSISIVATSSVTVLLKKKEYGVLFAFGATKQKIIIDFCKELILIKSIAFFIAYIYVYKSYSNIIISDFKQIYMRTLIDNSAKQLLLIMLFLLILILFIPITIISKYKPFELVREEE